MNNFFQIIFQKIKVYIIKEKLINMLLIFLITKFLQLKIKKLKKIKY